MKFTIPRAPLKVDTFARIGGYLAPERWIPYSGMGGYLAPDSAYARVDTGLGPGSESARRAYEKAGFKVRFGEIQYYKKL